MSLFNDKNLKTREYMEGVVIFSAGDKPKEAYLIHEGEVEIYRREESVRHNIATLTDGDIFGEMAIIQGKEHTSYAVAKTKTHVVLIPERMLKEKLGGSDPLIQAIIHNFTKRLYKSNEDKT